MSEKKLTSEIQAAFPYVCQSEAIEKMLFAGLKKAGTMPVDPGGPTDAPSRMLPVPSFLPDETDKVSSAPECLGPIEQAMRDNPSLTREAAEEELAAHGF